MGAMASLSKRLSPARSPGHCGPWNLFADKLQNRLVRMKSNTPMRNCPRGAGAPISPRIRAVRAVATGVHREAPMKLSGLMKKVAKKFDAQIHQTEAKAKAKVA